MTIKEKGKVYLKGLDEDSNNTLNERIEFFEANHEPNIVHNHGDGWIPRMSAVNYAFAGIINLGICCWLFVALI